MKSARASDNSGEIGLFPFLAVLLCTMGAMLVLLVVLAEQARRSPISASRNELSESAADQDLADRLSEAQQNLAKLVDVRRQAERRLQDEQARLSHLEEHARRVEHDLARLHLVNQQLIAAEKEQVVDQDQAQRELLRLQQMADDARESVAQLEQESVDRKSYAIVPYRGSSGTLRRPIYVECTKDGVVIQPEGIRLTEQDFLGPRRPGNPLASAIRAAREQLSARAQGRAGQDPPDPYPLLVVRPGGGGYYTAALWAIRSWDADFGYEFVEADWDLKYPEIDPQLEQAMFHAVEQARQRQRLLAQIAPSRYGGISPGIASQREGSGMRSGGTRGGSGKAFALGSVHRGSSGGDDSLFAVESPNAGAEAAHSGEQFVANGESIGPAPRPSGGG
ncbi:MAG: hypothetical protein AAF961_17105, partial [Planctomycetota bacterium]